jgi:hypothetical protein
MKIDYVIMSTDGNELYDNFWEINKKIWYDIIGVLPILVIIGSEDKIEKFDDSIIVTFKKVEDIKTSFQSQVARLYVTSLFLENTLLISDIDMIPLSKNYFINLADEVKENQILIYTSDAYGYKNQKRYPMCYNLAKGKTYHEILNLDSSFQEFVLRLKNLNLIPLWDTDELYFGDCIYKFEKENHNRIVKKERGFRYGYATNRIDRDYWFSANYDYDKISDGFYYDCHSLRPYKKYKKEIDNIVNLILK